MGYNTFMNHFNISHISISIIHFKIGFANTRFLGVKLKTVREREL